MLSFSLHRSHAISWKQEIPQFLTKIARINYEELSFMPLCDIDSRVQTCINWSRNSTTQVLAQPSEYSCKRITDTDKRTDRPELSV